MAAHYGVAVIPARVGKPRDKAKVEAGVLVVERWILAALRKQRFFSIGELNEAIKELIEKHPASNQALWLEANPSRWFAGSSKLCQRNNRFGSNST